MIETLDILSVADLALDPESVVSRVHASGEPLVITRQGQAEVIMVSLDSYQRGERERQLLRLLVRGEKEIAAGVGYDLDVVMAEADDILNSGSV